MKRVIKRFTKKFRRGEKGFTLVELLVVIAIIGVLAAVVVPNVGQFMGRGETEAKRAELHNIQTAVIAMLVDSDAGVLASTYTGVTDMDDVKTTDTPAKVLSDYLTGLNTDGTIKTKGISYDFETDGTVTPTP
jgi:type IV pilus assembly protein PilA